MAKQILSLNFFCFTIYSAHNSDSIVMANAKTAIRTKWGKNNTYNNNNNNKSLKCIFFYLFIFCNKKFFAFDFVHDLKKPLHSTKSVFFLFLFNLSADVCEFLFKKAKRKKKLRNNGTRSKIYSHKPSTTKRYNFTVDDDDDDASI